MGSLVAPGHVFESVNDHHALFFFQAEDGIRDDLVTGVQTCALPILPSGVTHLIPGPKGIGGRAVFSKDGKTLLLRRDPSSLETIDVETGKIIEHYDGGNRSEEHTSELQSPDHLVCRLLLEKKKRITH